MTSAGARRSEADVIEDVEWLDSTGVGAFEAARRLEFASASALEKYLERHGKCDLWLRLKKRDPEGSHYQEKKGTSVVTTIDPIAGMLARSKKSRKASTRRLAERIDALLADLTQREEAEQAEKREQAQREAERAKARDEVHRLREQLAAAEKLLGRKPKASNGEAAKIRAWARENGYEVPTRGQVAASIRDAYAAAQGGAS